MKPVIYVPGLPASELLDAATKERLFLNLGLLISKTARQKLLPRLEGPNDPTKPDGVVAGLPIADILDLPLLDVGKPAQSLYDILRTLGYTGFRPPFGSHFRAVGWDWRLPVDHAEAQRALAAAIDDLHASTGKGVVPILHSTGGLVLRALVEARPALVDKIDRVVSLGVPWAGTLKSFRFLAGNTGFFPLTKAETQHTIGRSWAAYDLLPPDPAKTPDAPPLFFAAGNPSSPLVARGWIPAGADRAPMVARAQRSDQLFGQRSRRLEPGGRALPITTVAGWGVATDTAARLVAGGKVEFESTPEGDGTIPFVSASWLQGVASFFAPLGFYPTDNLPERHSTLWSSPPVRALLAEAAHRRGAPRLRLRGSRPRRRHQPARRGAGAGGGARRQRQPVAGGQGAGLRAHRPRRSTHRAAGRRPRRGEGRAQPHAIGEGGRRALPPLRGHHRVDRRHHGTADVLVHGLANGAGAVVVAGRR